MKRLLLAAPLAIWAGISDAATLGFDIVAQGTRVSTTTFSPFETTNAGTSVSAVGINDAGDILVGETSFGGSPQFLKISGGVSNVFAVIDSNGPNGIGADTSFSVGAIMQNGSLLGQLFDQANNTRAHVEIAQGGATQVLFQGVGAIGSKDVQPVDAGRETADGSAFGVFLRDLGGTGNTFNGTGIVAVANGTPSIIAQKGSAIVGRSDVTINNVDAFEFDANRAGQIVIETSLQGAGVNTATDPSSGFPIGNVNALVMATAAGLEIFVEGGSAAPDGLGTFSQFFNDFVINESGDLLFRARVYDAATGEFQVALFLRKSDGSLSTIAKAGDPVPGSTTGATIRSSVNPDLADDGTIIYGASTSDNSNPVIRVKDGVAEVIMQIGDAIDLGNGTSAAVTSVGVRRDFLRTGDDFLLEVRSSGGLIFDSGFTSYSQTTETFVLRSKLVPDNNIGVVPVPASLPLLVGGLGFLILSVRRSSSA